VKPGGGKAGVSAAIALILAGMAALWAAFSLGVHHLIDWIWSIF
jgi:hypothetical protein